MPLTETNLALRRAGGEQKVTGKVVRYRGEWVFHSWAQTSWQRYDSLSWGLNTALVEWLKLRHVELVYLYLAERNVTYGSTVARLQALGVVQPCPPWGHSLNLPVDEWEVRRGRLELPWVPEHRLTIIALEAPSAAAATDGQLRLL